MPGFRSCSGTYALFELSSLNGKSSGFSSTFNMDDFDGQKLFLQTLKTNSIIKCNGAADELFFQYRRI
jgi:hypothetical protein